MRSANHFTVSLFQQYNVKCKLIGLLYIQTKAFHSVFEISYLQNAYYQSHGLGRLSYHVFLNKNSIEKVNIA